MKIDFAQGQSGADVPGHSGAGGSGASGAPGHSGGGVHVEARDLSKSYGGRDVLRTIDLTIQAGEFVAIVGRSGCGKSTLLRLLANLEAPSGGRIAFGAEGDGHDPGAARNGHEAEAWSARDATRSARAFTRIMFQDARLLPWKRVQANVALGLPKSAAHQAGRALRAVGLEARAHDWPSVLSGGQRQRVALARALVHEPELLLLDEPLGALDALTRIEMQQLIESLWRARGFTVLLVTHDVQEAVALADRVILIEEGRIALDERIGLPRPRSRGAPDFARREERILQRVMGQAVV